MNTQVKIKPDDTRPRIMDAAEALFRRIAQLLGDKPGIRPEDVFVNVLDAAKENWSVGHGLVQFA